MRIINHQITGNKRYKNSNNDSIIYHKGLFISFKILLIVLLLSSVVCIQYFYPIDTWLDSFKINDYVSAIIFFTTTTILLLILSRTYVLVLKKIEKKYTIYDNRISYDVNLIGNINNDIDSYLIDIQKKHNSSKKNKRKTSLLFNYHEKGLDTNIQFIGDVEYSLFRKHFYIKYNSLLLQEIQEIIATKNNEYSRYEYSKKQYNLDDKVFYYLEMQLKLRIERLEKM